MAAAPIGTPSLRTGTNGAALLLIPAGLLSESAMGRNSKPRIPRAPCGEHWPTPWEQLLQGSKTTPKMTQAAKRSLQRQVPSTVQKAQRGVVPPTSPRRCPHSLLYLSLFPEHAHYITLWEFEEARLNSGPVWRRPGIGVSSKTINRT